MKGMMEFFPPLAHKRAMSLERWSLGLLGNLLSKEERQGIEGFTSQFLCLYLFLNIK
jgi:hypothetical protein